MNILENYQSCVFQNSVGTQNVYKALLSNFSSLKPTVNPNFDLKTLRFLYIILSCRYNLLYFAIVKTNDFILLGGTYSNCYISLCYLWVDAVLFRFWQNFSLTHCIETHLYEIYCMYRMITHDGEHRKLDWSVQHEYF